MRIGRFDALRANDAGCVELFMRGGEREEFENNLFCKNFARLVDREPLLVDPIFCMTPFFSGILHLGPRH